jgi:hypothetical protein
MANSDRDSISTKIEEGIKAADYLAVWLTKNAVASHWVDREWRTKFKNEIDSGQVLVLPLLAKDCDIPAFLQDKRYADFRSSYEAGFVELMSRFKPPSSKPCSPSSRVIALAEILVLLDAAQWVLNILNIARPFYGNDSSLTKRKRLNIAKDVARRAEIKIAGYVADEPSNPKLDLKAILDALNYLIHVTDQVLPQLGQYRSSKEKRDGTEWFAAANALCDLLPRSGSDCTPASLHLDSAPALNAEFVAVRADNSRLYELFGFKNEEAYNQHINPSVSTIISSADPLSPPARAASHRQAEALSQSGVDSHPRQGKGPARRA